MPARDNPMYLAIISIVAVVVLVFIIILIQQSYRRTHCIDADGFRLAHRDLENRNVCCVRAFICSSIHETKALNNSIVDITMAIISKSSFHKPLQWRRFFILLFFAIRCMFPTLTLDLVHGFIFHRRYNHCLYLFDGVCPHHSLSLSRLCVYRKLFSSCKKKQDC